jgi:GNAT superfamily N-acetyltransferase
MIAWVTLWSRLGGRAAQSKVVAKDFVLRPASDDDAEWMADLKAEAMRADLERLGYWDRDWARGRFLEAYVAANTMIIETEDRIAGIIAVRPERDAIWIEHFYLYAWAQGQGLGGRVLDHVMAWHRDHRPFTLAIDRGSAVRRLYERHGFIYRYDADNGVDQVFTT